MEPRARPRSRPARRNSPGDREQEPFPKALKGHYLVVDQVDQYTIRLYEKWGDEHGETMAEYKFHKPIQLLHRDTFVDNSIEVDAVCDREVAEGLKAGLSREDAVKNMWASEAVVHDPFEHLADECFDGIANDTGDCLCQCIDCLRSPEDH